CPRASRAARYGTKSTSCASSKTRERRSWKCRWGRTPGRASSLLRGSKYRSSSRT
ncbi:hypothetical protein V8D89_007193, partial [Ganoderma adspersum]